MRKAIVRHDLFTFFCVYFLLCPRWPSMSFVFFLFRWFSKFPFLFIRPGPTIGGVPIVWRRNRGHPPVLVHVDTA